MPSSEQDNTYQRGLAGGMTNPLQVLGVNLHFLQLSHERLSTMIGLHRVNLGYYPLSVAERLRRSEADLGVEYFEMETAKVFEETEECLARLLRVMAQLGV